MFRSPAEIANELLVVRCRRGESRAWDELVSEYHDRLYYFVRRLIEDEDRARQLIQEAWLKIFRGLPSLQKTNRLIPWMYTVVRRTVLTDLRKRYATPEKSAGDLFDSALQSEDGVDTSIALENAELVHFGLSQIGLLEREVLTLFFLEELSIEEIATVLTIPAGTVKSRLSRARRELQKVLELETGRTVRETMTP